MVPQMKMLWNLYVQSVEQNKGDIGAANPGLNTGLDSLAGFLKIIGRSSLVAYYASRIGTCRAHVTRGSCCARRRVSCTQEADAYVR